MHAVLFITLESTDEVFMIDHIGSKVTSLNSTGNLEIPLSSLNN